MNERARDAMLARLVDRLREQGSWSGETHVQKAVFLLQEMLSVPTGYEFILYRHGPFSFDLRDGLTSLRADDLLELEIQPPPYGPKLKTTDLGRQLQGLYPKTLGRYEGHLDHVARFLGERGVTELERLATALYATRCEEGMDRSVVDRANLIHRWKPHVSVEDARKAVEAIDRALTDPKAQELRETA